MNIQNLVCAGKDRQQEWEWGLRSFDNKQSIRLPRSERVASLQRNESGKKKKRVDFLNE